MCAAKVPLASLAAAGAAPKRFAATKRHAGWERAGDAEASGGRNPCPSDSAACHTSTATRSPALGADLWRRVGV